MDLVTTGAWRHERRRRRLRRLGVLVPTGDARELPEPLRFADALLRDAPALGADGARDLRAAARHVARTRPRAGTAAVERTREELAAGGLLVQGTEGREPSPAARELVTAAGLNARRRVPWRGRHEPVGFAFAAAGIAPPTDLALVEAGWSDGWADHAAGSTGGGWGGMGGGHDGGGGFDGGGGGGGGGDGGGG